MQTIRELITKWGFQVDDKPLDGIEKRLDAIKSRLDILAAAAILQGIVNLTERFATFAEELHVAAESAGITVEAFQKLAFAAGQSNISQEQMSMAMARLARNIEQARMGSEQAQLAFQKIGISGEQVRGFRNSADALRALADRFQGLHDPILKQATALQLMGRGSLNFVSFLSQGSKAIKGLEKDAEDFGAVLSSSQIEALVKVEHALNAIWSVMKAVGATIASYLAPSLEFLIRDFLEFYKANKQVIDTNVRAWAYDFAFALGYIYGWVKTLVEWFLKLSETHGTLIRRVLEIILAFEFFAGVIGAIKGALGLLKGSILLVGEVLEPLQWLWAKAFTPAFIFIGTLLKEYLLRLLAGMGSLIETFLPGLAEAFYALGAAMISTPIGWIVAGVAALVFALQAAWTLLSGGKWEDTWIAKVFSAVKGFGGKLLNFVGLGGDQSGATASTSNGLQNLSNLPGLNSVPQEYTAGAFAQSSDQGNIGQYSVNAPVNIYIQGSADPKAIGQKVREGIADHLDRLNRRTAQSFAPSQAY